MSRKIIVIGIIVGLLVGFGAAVALSKAVIPSSIVYGILALGFVVGCIVFFQKYNPHERDIMKKATKYVMKYWMEEHDESLTNVNARKMYKEYDGVPHVGFTFRRLNGIRVGQACNIIVKKIGSGFTVVNDDELVTDAYELMNPFHYFGGTMEGAPVPYPERHMILGLGKSGKHSTGNNVYVGTKDFEQNQNKNQGK